MNKRNLDKWEILLIRTCKACLSYDETVRRMKKILGMRSGIHSSYIEESDIKYFLIKIIDDYNLSNLSKFISTVSRFEDYAKYSFDDIDQDYMLLACDSIISHTIPKEVFPNYISPAIFRNIKTN
jgi:hypothetical protein